MVKIIRFMICLFTLVFIGTGLLQVTAGETGTLVITGTPIDGIQKYGFVLYKDLRQDDGTDEIEVWLTKEENWRTELTLPYGKYYALVDDTALLPKEVDIPVNCRYVLRFGDSPFYETYEINQNKRYDGEDKEPIALYLVSTVSGGAGTKITNIELAAEAQEYIIGENEMALESAMSEIDNKESIVDEFNEITESSTELTEDPIVENERDGINLLNILVALFLTVAAIVTAIIVYRIKQNED